MSFRPMTPKQVGFRASGFKSLQVYSLKLQKLDHMTFYSHLPLLLSIWPMEWALGRWLPSQLALGHQILKYPYKLTYSNHKSMEKGVLFSQVRFMPFIIFIDIWLPKPTPNLRFSPNFHLTSLDNPHNRINARSLHLSQCFPMIAQPYPNRLKVVYYLI